MGVLAVLASLALVGDAPLVVMAGGLLAVEHPMAAALAIGAWTIKERFGRSTVAPGEEARFLRSVATGLRSGLSPRLALLTAGKHHPLIPVDRMLRAIALGLSTDRIADEMRACLPLNGRLAAAAMTVAGHSGAPMGRVMEVLAQRAVTRSRLERERRAVSAQARATAWLISGVPICLLVLLALTNRLGSTAARGVVGVGLVLQAVGIGVVALMLRSRR